MLRRSKPHQQRPRRADVSLAVTAPALVTTERSLLSGTRLHIANGSLEALKWIALVAMLLDHVNKYLFDARLPVLFEIGRIAMPLFGFVLAYNLARPDAMARGAPRRVASRLLVLGAVSQIPFAMLGGLWPLNILFTLLVFVMVVMALQAGGLGRLLAATALVLLAGAVVEFFWLGIAYGLAAWWFCQRTSAARLSVWLASTAALGLVNGNLWSLLAPWLVLVASQIDLTVPRHAKLFYAAYPAHLAILWLARTLV